MKILIIGKNIESARLAARIRRLDFNIKIILTHQGNYDLPSELESIYDIKIRRECRLINIDRENNVAHLEDMITEHVFHESFDKIILADIRPGRLQADQAMSLSHVNQHTGIALDYRRDNIIGREAVYIGMNTQQLEKNGVDYVYSVVCEGSCFYQLIYSVDGRFLGAVGFGDGCGDVMDVLAACLKNVGMEQLAFLELSRADHPAIVLGKIAQNVVLGRLFMAYWDELPFLDHERTMLLDVRRRGAASAKQMEGVIPIPIEELRQSFYRLDKSKEILVFCDTGKLSYIACSLLMQAGYDVRHLTGGLNFYDLMRVTEE